ncbi:hypothetical protein A3850_011410 [Lewinella sp. 4G2]|nr:hypothetical protein A3850_011410 [Lewinella sp. 4G2]
MGEGVRILDVRFWILDGRVVEVLKTPRGWNENPERVFDEHRATRFTPSGQGEGWGIVVGVDVS